MEDTELGKVCATACAVPDPDEWNAWGLFAACVAMEANPEDVQAVMELLDVPKPARSRADKVIAGLEPTEWAKAARVLVEAGVYSKRELAEQRHAWEQQGYKSAPADETVGNETTIDLENYIDASQSDQTDRTEAGENEDDQSDDTATAGDAMEG